MMRNAAAVLAAIFCLVASQVHALGLGTISLESSLNQPLRARIEIIDLGSVSPAEVAIQMASQQDFERFDLERTGFLSNVNLDIERTGDGVFVVLTSTQAVREPFLSFILDTRWPSGRILSEHTVLLDLPVFSDGQAVPEPINQPVSPVVEDQQGTVNREPAGGQPVSASESAATEPATADSEPATTASETTAAAPQEQVISQSPARPDTLEIQELDTLWEVAMRVRPDESVSIQQTMLAIQRMNPEAFADGNINRLIAGETIQVPDLSDIRSVNQQQAVSEVNRQNQQADLSAQPLTAPSAGPSSLASESRQGQLRVLTAEDAQPVSGGGSAAVEAENAQLDAEILALESQLLIQQEEADRVRLQQAEMTSRLDDLDAQIASAMEIIRLQDQQLAQLQASLATAQAEAATQQQAAADTAPASLTQSQPLQTTPTSFLDSVIRVLSSSSTVLAIVVALVVLLMVMLLIRRNRLAAAEGLEDELGDELPAGRVAVAGSQVNTEHFEIPDPAREDEAAVAEVAELASASMAEDDLDSALGDEIEDFDLDGYRSDSEATGTAGEDLDVEISIEDEDDPVAEDHGVDNAPQVEEKTDWQVGTVSSGEDDVADSVTNSADSVTNSAYSVPNRADSVTDVGEDTAESADADEGVDFELDTDVDSSGPDGDEADLDVVDFDIDEFLDEDDSDADASAGTGNDAQDDEPGGIDFDLGEEVAEDSDGAVVEDVMDLEEADAESDAADDFETLELEPGESTAAGENPEDSDEPEQFNKDVAAEFIEFDEASADEAGGDDAGKTAAVSAEEAVAEFEEEAADESSEVETLDFDLSDAGLDGFDGDPKGDQVDVSSDADDEVESFDFDLTEEPEQEKAADQATDHPKSNGDEGVTGLDFEQPAANDREDDAASQAARSGDSEKTASPDSAIELSNLDFLSDQDDSAANGADEDIEFLSDDDEAATKLDLAYAYQKMGDVSGAKEILEEVINEGNDAQVNEARTLIAALGK